MRRTVVGAVAGLAVAASTLGGPVPAAIASDGPEPVLVAQSSVTVQSARYKFKNCTAMNKVYAHGVGRKGARDHTSGTPVTNFKKSTKLYKKIIRYRSGLDRDKDGIACEKA